MDPNVKQFQITGGAAQSYGPKEKRKTRKKTSPGTITQVRSHVPGDAPVVEPPKPAPAALAAPAPVKRETKVVLAAAKKRSVVLQPKAQPKKTRRASRSINVSVDGLGKRLVRAKTIRKDSVSLDISEVKKVLHKAGLIKMESKAPESILRQMYADFMTLKDRAL